MSITLTTPYVVSVGGSQVENDLAGGCVSMTMDYQARLLTYVFMVGTVAGSPAVLTTGPYGQRNGQTVTVSVYVGPNVSGGLQTGQWWLTTGTGGGSTLQGSLVSGATLAPIITQLLANKNTSEGFVAVSGGLMPGTTVAWTAL
jgi:hypothetical protein